MTKLYDYNHVSMEACKIMSVLSDVMEGFDIDIEELTSIVTKDSDPRAHDIHNMNLISDELWEAYKALDYAVKIATESDRFNKLIANQIKG